MHHRRKEYIDNDVPQLNWHYYVWVNAISVHALYIVIIVRRPHKYVTQFMHYLRIRMYMSRLCK